MPKFKFNFNHGTRYVNGPLVNLGATRGKGSSARMLSHCKSNSENPSECINKFININNQTNVNEIDVIINLYNALSDNFIDEFDNLVTKYNL
jgi:hypothetical protein